MTSIAIVEDTKERLCFSSQPSSQRWAFFFGFISFGLGLAYYSECCCWQLIYVGGSVIMAASFLGQWQETVLDRNRNKLDVQVQNFLQKTFIRSKFLRSESVELNQLKHMKTNPGNGTVILFFGSVTVTIAAGSPKECDRFLAKIRAFLQMDMTVKDDLASTPLDPQSDDISSISSEDSFERIDAADLAEYAAAQPDQKNEEDDGEVEDEVAEEEVAEEVEVDNNEVEKDDSTSPDPTRGTEAEPTESTKEKDNSS